MRIIDLPKLIPGVRDNHRKQPERPAHRVGAFPELTYEQKRERLRVVQDKAKAEKDQQRAKRLAKEAGLTIHDNTPEAA